MSRRLSPARTRRQELNHACDFGCRKCRFSVRFGAPWLQERFATDLKKLRAKLRGRSKHTEFNTTPCLIGSGVLLCCLVRVRHALRYKHTCTHAHDCTRTNHTPVSVFFLESQANMWTRRWALNLRSSSARSMLPSTLPWNVTRRGWEQLKQ